MCKLSFVTILFFTCVIVAAQSPHGDKLKIDCADCHTTASWVYSAKTSVFNHDKQTDFVLEGQHKFTGCIKCHTTLVFSDAKAACISCHTDMHNATVGSDCGRCHDSRSWIVENITQLHQQSRFPLLGAHNTADCSECHKSASRLEFEPLGVECVDCHLQEFLATTQPNHQQAGFSRDCFECHNIDAHEWTSSGFNHNFFPLTGGHQIKDCTACHGNNILTPISSDCYSCHQKDYNATTNPNHMSLGFSTSCGDCHTTNPGWKPAGYTAHDQQYFPIYSGSHRGVWNSCAECHTAQSNYTVFTCVTSACHARAHHQDQGSSGCYSCHRNGRSEGD